MKKTIFFLVVIYIYLIVPLGFIYLNNNIEESETYSIFMIVTFITCLLLLVIACILNIREAIKLYKDKDYKQLKDNMKIVKLASIPFFIAEALILIAMIVGFSMLALFFFWTIGGPVALAAWVSIAALIIYLVMLTSSVSGIAFVMLLQKEKVINISMLLVLILLQCIPIADIITTISVLSKYNIENK